MQCRRRYSYSDAQCVITNRVRQSCESAEIQLNLWGSHRLSRLVGLSIVDTNPIYHSLRYFKIIKTFWGGISISLHFSSIHWIMASVIIGLEDPRCESQKYFYFLYINPSKSVFPSINSRTMNMNASFGGLLKHTVVPHTKNTTSVFWWNRVTLLY